jgi:hypothetical protein
MADLTDEHSKPYIRCQQTVVLEAGASITSSARPLLTWGFVRHTYAPMSYISHNRTHTCSREAEVESCQLCG